MPVRGMSGGRGGYGNDKKKKKPKKMLGPAGTIKLGGTPRASAISMKKKSKPMKLSAPKMAKPMAAPTINISIGKPPRAIARPGNKPKRKK